MKPSLLLLFIFFGVTSIKSQVVNVSGQCISGLITLNPFDSIAGKPSYTGTGSVDGNVNTQVSVYWMPAPDDIWVLDFDGQPYFQTTCDLEQPPPTGGSCLWTLIVDPDITCTGPDPLVINGSGTLPIKIIDFTAQTRNREVVLNWKTTTEINNKGFEIQRSADGIRWAKIGFVNGSINSSVEKNYQFSDAYPLTGKNFYRLLQFDADNNVSYSFIVSVKILKPGFYTISNNPGRGLYRLHIEAGTEKINFSVFDAAGRKIMSKINNGPGDQTIDISNSAPGIYLLRIQKGTGSFTERLVKL